MSYTTAYTPLFRFDAESGEVDRDSNPRVLDPEGLDTVPSSVSKLGEDTFQSLKIMGEEQDYSTYPKETYKTLKGFKTHKPAGTFGGFRLQQTDKQALVDQIRGHEDRSSAPLGYVFNIERVGIEYGGVEGVWKSLFSEVSRHTDPFAFFQSSRPHSFPDVTEVGSGTDQSVYYVECVEGDVRVEERTVGLVETEVLVDEFDSAEESET